MPSSAIYSLFTTLHTYLSFFQAQAARHQQLLRVPHLSHPRVSELGRGHPQAGPEYYTCRPLISVSDSDPDSNCQAGSGSVGIRNPDPDPESEIEL